MHFQNDDGSREFFAKRRHGVRVAWLPHGSAIVNKDCFCASFGHEAKGPKDKDMKPTKFSAFVRWWRPQLVVFAGRRKVVSWGE